MVTRMGKGHVSWGQPHPIPGGGRATLPIFAVPLYLCLYTWHRMTEFDVVTHGRGLLGVSHAITFAQMRRAVCQR